MILITFVNRSNGNFSEVTELFWRIIFIMGLCILLRVLSTFVSKTALRNEFSRFFIYTLYRNMFRPIWWPSSGESYEIHILYMCILFIYIYFIYILYDRLCGLVVRVLGYRSGGLGSIPGTTNKKSSGSGTGCTQPREYNWGATW
jgi:hypothetical protein